MKIVAWLTYLSVISVVAFVIFALSKTTPEKRPYSLGIHFLGMLCAITFVWTKYVKVPRVWLPSFHVVNHHVVQVHSPFGHFHCSSGVAFAL